MDKIVRYGRKNNKKQKQLELTLKLHDFVHLNLGQSNANINIFYIKLFTMIAKDIKKINSHCILYNI